MAPTGDISFSMMHHEIGHVLGLQYSDDETSIIYPWYHDEVKSLLFDDKMTLEALSGPIQKDASTKILTRTLPIGEVISVIY